MIKFTHQIGNGNPRNKGGAGKNNNDKFFHKKSLGQNFLTNPHIAPKIAAALPPDVSVIEIGAGAGALTKELCKVARHVTAIETDPRIIPALRQTLTEYDNFDIINADAMTLPLDELNVADITALAANLPYYITTPLIMRYLEHMPALTAMVVMTQKEAAVRLCAAPGTRECGAISAAIRYYGEPEILFGVKRGSFTPAPNVDSAVMRINIHNKYRKKPDTSTRAFFRLTKAAFAMRRKQMQSCLPNSLGITKEQFQTALAQLEINPAARAEELTFEQLLKLSELV